MKKLSLTLVAASMAMTSAAGFASPATPVTVFEAQALDHTPVTFQIGRMEAVESAKLTPRVNGYLKAKFYDDGAMVQQGDVLFEIDPTPYKAAYDAAVATLAEAKAALQITELNHSRNQQMLETGGIAQAQIDLSIAELQMARSRVTSAQANVVVQLDNLEQTKVRAPYGGQLGKSNFSIGDMVGTAMGPLTDIVMLDPINVSFNVRESEITNLNLRNDDAVWVSLEIDNAIHPALGQVTFVDNKVNPTNGTISVSATFENEEAVLIPNQFARVGVSADHVNGVRIPHEAIHQDTASQYVMIIEEGVATRRDVTVADRQGQDVVVQEGLAAGEPVIIGGLQRIRAGAPVVAAN
ncbi:efflux RND transporter periplasmic adaptor subunit [Thaumasiovibrio subtropicus]|uniref:efflux RND transporter periplasmic adaptor subunit n=1 Tax=Thaumasiovibrio subtropicus TaxID=1891207 RepID=UPI000B34BB01|nr:efflux RND transporter periplasmic adaptor subunit [Thaumasiovibrio subtropicus]